MSRSPHAGPKRVAASVVRVVREWPGWLVAAAGAVLCVLGWYGVSGQNVIERQVPYLASATVPGAALIVAGAVLVTGRQARHGARAEERVEQLYDLLTADGGDEAAAVTPDPATAGGPARLVAVPDGTLYHLAACPMAVGKAQTREVDAETVRRKRLRPCPVCDPPVFPPSDAGPAAAGPAP